MDVPTESGKAGVVAGILIVVTSLCLFATDRFKVQLKRNRMAIPIVCLFYSMVAVITTAIVATYQANPSSGLFTTTSWFSAGWHTGLSVFSIRIDTWWKYTIIMLYQIMRSFLGSLVVNYFRSFLLTEIQAKGSTNRLYSINTVMFAQFAYNVFSFYSALTDSYLVSVAYWSTSPSYAVCAYALTQSPCARLQMLSQADLTCITATITIIADGQSTFYMMRNNISMELDDVDKSAIPAPLPEGLVENQLEVISQSKGTVATHDQNHRKMFMKLY